MSLLLTITISAILVSFLLWRRREDVKLSPEMFFDLVILYVVFSLLVGRTLFFIQNLTQFVHMDWSIYPFYYKPGAERIWLAQMPWVLLKIGEVQGVGFSGVLLGGFLATNAIRKLKKLSRSFVDKMIPPLIVGQLFEIITFFIKGFYYGKQTQSFLGIKYGAVDNVFRLPIQFIEIGLLLILLLLCSYLTKKRISVRGAYLFILGTAEVLVSLFIDNSGIVPYFNLVVFGVVILIGLLTLLFGEREEASNTAARKKIQETAGKSGTERLPYRQFRTSYTTYSKSNPSLVARLKRRISSGRVGAHKKTQPTAI